jgi:protoporphyrinogen oxidase
LGNTELKSKIKTIVIIGAGPAGLGCAMELTKTKNKLQKLLILDKNTVVGGLSRSFTYKRHVFDLGPHRFFTKNKEILKLWKNILGNELVVVKRMTRILYGGKLFVYPIQLSDILRKISLRNKLQIITSYLYSKLSVFSSSPKSFEEWCIQSFGEKLYRMFFKSYTEKVWGIPCRDLHVKWANQRIKNVSLMSLIKNAVYKNTTPLARSLIRTFYYPKKGAGYMYERLVKKYRLEPSLELNSRITGINHNGIEVTSLEYQINKKKKTVRVDQLFSSMPLTHFVLSLKPSPPHSIIEAANKLYYRDHITVNIIVKNSNPFPDQWIYVHSPSLKMARITNYSNFNASPKTEKTISLSVEYFSFKNDILWQQNDKQILDLAIIELDKTGLVNSYDVIDGFVIRETESYPTYYLNYDKEHTMLKDYVSKFINIQLIGRGGMYKYNNMDHAMYSGILAARNYLLGFPKYNIWDIDEDGRYIEER